MTRKNRFVILFTAAVMLAVLTAWPTAAAAQRRGSGAVRGGSGRPAAGHAVQRPPVRSSHVVYSAPYYRSYYSPYYSRYYSPYYWGLGGSFGWGWGTSFGWGYQYPYSQYSYYQYPYPYYPRYYNYEPGSDLRIQVTPKDAEVYLDGYLVGTVDDFDGVFQRLRVPYGEHDVSIYFQGYRTIEQKMLFRPGESYRIREVMQPAAAGAPPEARPLPSATAEAPGDERRRPPMRGGPPMRRGEPPMRPDEPPMRPGEPPAGPPNEREPRGDFGTVAIRVQPSGAEILIDGERWETPAGEDRLTVDLAEGTHHVEIRKDGHKPYSADVQVRSGRTSSLNVSLPPGN